MVKTDLHEIFRSVKLSNFTNTEVVELVFMVLGELDEGLDEVYW